MKKFFALLVSFLLLSGAMISAYAATDLSDDLSALTDEIVTTSNDLFSDKLSREITADDIEYINAFKIYVGTNIFETDVMNVAEIPDVFGADGYIYELPVYLDGDTLIVNIAKGKPLNEDVEFTDKERQGIMDKVGKWQVTAIKYYNDEIIDYTAEIENKIGAAPKDAVLVGGLPYFRYAIALLPDESGAIEGFIPLSDVPGIENIDAIKINSENAYNYEAVKDYVLKLPPLADDEAGTYGFLNTASEEKPLYCMLIAGVVLSLVIVGSSVIVIYRKKMR